MCLWATDRGSVCATAGNEPDTNAAPLWEAGGSGADYAKEGGLAWRVFKGWGSGRKTTVTRRGGSNSAGNRAGRGFKGWRGRRNHGDNPKSGNAGTTEDKYSESGGDGGSEDTDTPPLGEEQAHDVTRSAKTFMERGRIKVETETTTVTPDEVTKVTEITWQSPRPKGAWKARLGLFFEEGRQIRDSSLTITPTGEVEVQTPDGRQLWSIPLSNESADKDSGR